MRLKIRGVKTQAESVTKKNRIVVFIGDLV